MSQATEEYKRTVARAERAEAKCAELQAELDAIRALEPVAWHTEDHLTDKSATTYDKNMRYRWEWKGWPITPLYALPEKK
jgi:uncharacterized membrane protein